MTDSALIRALSSGYRVPVIDYGVRSIDGTGPQGLLVSSGCGIMMATMDACPELRWCVDVDELTAGSNFGAWLRCVVAIARPIAVVGWFSITDPKPLQDALADLPVEIRAWIGSYTMGAKMPVGFRFDRLEDLVNHVRG